MILDIFPVKTGLPEVRVVHHQDLNKSILIALIIASTLLGGILLFLSCFWIYRQKTLKHSNGKKGKPIGILFSSNISFDLCSYSIIKIMNNHNVSCFPFPPYSTFNIHLKRLQRGCNSIQ